MSRDILLLVDALAREKNVDKEIVFGALELALASATKKRFNEDVEVRAHVDRATGDFYEHAIKAGGDPKRVSNLILSHGRRLCNEKGCTLNELGILPERVAEIELQTRTAYLRALLAQELEAIAAAALQQAEAFLRQERLRFEDRSRNTFENAVYAYEAAQPWSQRRPAL